MRLILVICFAAAVEAGVGDYLAEVGNFFRKLFGGNKMEDGNKEKLPVISPDPGQLTELHVNPNLGDEIKIPRAGSKNPSEGAEIYIPSNRVPVKDDRIMQ
ncbi:unnamed protein product [Cylicocyclus nassatus]|uniref:Uncharacterized protein n=1 Tax=Cylicocyclus nassatus TaxID=53992 RepID=A0AA36DNN3_CYLNA|nr:unnamed protein product [Cylicocyclus nassatus]